MEYNYNEETLLHSVGFNLGRFVSVLKYGILSFNMAQNLGIKYTKNYLPDRQREDVISTVKMSLVDEEDIYSAYNLYIKNGISFIIEDVMPIEMSIMYHRRNDEVLVKDNIFLNNIVGIYLPKEYSNTTLDKLPIIPKNITKYDYLFNIVMDYIFYLKSYNAIFDKELINTYFKEIFLIHKALYTSKNNILDTKELISDYKDVLEDLNSYLSEVTYETFKKILRKNVTLKDIVLYLSNNCLPIYELLGRKEVLNEKLPS